MTTASPRPYRVALHGAYRTDNYGDMLLMLLYVRWLTETADAVEMRFPFVPGATARHLDPGAARGAGALRAVDSFVYAGGGYFGEPPTDQRRWGLRLAARHLLPGLALAQLGRDVVISGVGAGPVSLGLARRMLARVVARASLITVRDEPSRAFLVELGALPDRITVAADAALVLRPASVPRAAVDAIDGWLRNLPPGPRLGVHLSNPSRTGAAYAAILDDIVAFAAGHPEVRIVPLSDQRGAGGQLAAIEELVRRLPGRCDPYRYEDPWRLTALLGRLTMVITSKLHVGIVAAALGSAVLSYPRHPKVARFYDQIGARDATHALLTVRPGQVLEHLRHRFDRPDGIITIDPAIRASADLNRVMLQRHLRSRIEAAG